MGIKNKRPSKQLGRYRGGLRTAEAEIGEAIRRNPESPRELWELG